MALPQIPSSFLRFKLPLLNHCSPPPPSNPSVPSPPPSTPPFVALRHSPSASIVDTVELLLSPLPLPLVLFPGAILPLQIFRVPLPHHDAHTPPHRPLLRVIYSDGNAGTADVHSCSPSRVRPGSSRHCWNWRTRQCG